MQINIAGTIERKEVQEPSVIARATRHITVVLTAGSHHAPRQIGADRAKTCLAMVRDWGLFGCSGDVGFPDVGSSFHDASADSPGLLTRPLVGQCACAMSQ